LTLTLEDVNGVVIIHCKN